MKTTIYAAYGSNINLHQMAFRCPSARVVGTGYLDDYELTFRRGGFANVEPREGARTPILLWRIEPEDERSLDRYEGYPRFYQKEYAAASFPELGEVRTMVYVMNPGARGGYEMPTETYLTGILEGYRDNGMPTEELNAAVAENAKRITEQERTYRNARKETV